MPLVRNQGTDRIGEKTNLLYPHVSLDWHFFFFFILKNFTHMLKLPTGNQAPKSVNPKTLAIFGYPKTGKSRIVTWLTNYLIIDLEEWDEEMQLSTKKYASSSICVKTYHWFNKVLELIKHGWHKYSYLVIDSLTKLQDMCEVEAKEICKKQNRSYDAHGTGIWVLKERMRYYIDTLCQYAEHVIFIWHVVDRQEKDKFWEDTVGQQVMLTWDMKVRVPAQVDAIGHFQRDWYEWYLVFDSEKSHLGSRSAHLTGKKIHVSTYDPSSDSLKTYWEHVYIPGSDTLTVNHTLVENAILHIKEHWDSKSYDQWVDLISTGKLNLKEKELVLSFINSYAPWDQLPTSVPHKPTKSGKNEPTSQDDIEWTST